MHLITIAITKKAKNISSLFITSHLNSFSASIPAFRSILLTIVFWFLFDLLCCGVLSLFGEADGDTKCRAPT